MEVQRQYALKQNVMKIKFENSITKDILQNLILSLPAGNLLHFTFLNAIF